MSQFPPMLPFNTLAGLTVDLKIIDIGANPIDGEPPYRSLLDSGTVSLIGFEPNPEALAKLNTLKGPHETYLPHAVGDGGEHTLNICRAPGMTSLLTPNPVVLDRMHGFPLWGEVIDKIQVQTVRLDDVPETKGADYLKIDIQGGELMAFTHGVERLKDISVIHTEVEFLPMYVDQPLFYDVAQFLGKHGFVFHQFSPLSSRVVGPLMVNNSPYESMNQVFWGDAIFIKDFTKTEAMSDHQLLAMARILHDTYQSFDVALYLLTQYDLRQQTQVGARYLAGLQGQPATALAS